MAHILVFDTCCEYFGFGRTCSPGHCYCLLNLRSSQVTSTVFHPDDDNLASKCSIFTRVLSATVAKNTDQRTSSLKNPPYSTRHSSRWFFFSIVWRQPDRRDSLVPGSCGLEEYYISVCVTERAWDECLRFFELHTKWPARLGLQHSHGSGLRWFGVC